MTVFTNTSHGVANDLAAKVLAARIEGKKVLVAGREVHTPFHTSAAQVWANGTISFSVRQKSNPSRATDLFVKQGQSVTVEIL